jgi:hypothetical protein
VVNPNPIGPNVVRGFHGTNIAAAKSILSTGFLVSSNSYDWLGRGVYFWQESSSRAKAWAQQKWADQWAVVEVEIDIADCMDLLEGDWFSLINSAYDEVVGSFRSAGRDLPRQSGLVHGLDREVIEFVVAGAEHNGTEIGSVRAAFQEGVPAFPGSALFTKAHVQIAVRNPARIEIVSVTSETGVVQ